MNYEHKFKEITGFDAYEDNNLRPKVPSDYYVKWLEEKLSINGIVVSLPKFKKGQTLKRVSKYTDDFTEITIAYIEDTEAGFRYTSENGVCFYENELSAY